MTDDMQRARESYESDFRLLQQLRTWGLLHYPQETAALRAAPEGLALVPVDLRTGAGYEVWEAGIRVRNMGGSVEEMWAAMLAARPQGVK
jgi:hypothetical protein